jgi:hypothetical protein
MDAATLLPLPADGQLVIRERAVRVMVSATTSDTGLVAREGLAADRILTSVQEEEEDFELRNVKFANSWLTLDNPFLSREQQQRLDERGLIRPGTTVRQGDVLASVLGSVLPSEQRPQHEGKTWVRDESWTAPRTWHGTQVTKVELLGGDDQPKKKQSGVYERVRIVVRGEHDLAIGDLLLAGESPLGVVSHLVADSEMPLAPDGKAVDLLLPPAVGKRHGWEPGETITVSAGKAEEPAGQAVESRAVGPYSLITEQPLARCLHPGQLVSACQITWLLSRGLTANVAELCSLKCDDLGNRKQMRELVADGRLPPEAVPDAGTPESLATLCNELMALGLTVTFEKSPGGIALSVRPASDDDILGWSGGEIRKPETIDYRTLDEIEGGLFCPRTFGPVHERRRRRFGHILLPAPVVSPLWRLVKPSVLEEILELPHADAEKILRGEVWVRRSGQAWEMGPADINRQPEPDQFAGAAAIEGMLKAVPAHRLPDGLKDNPAALVQRVVPVLPADLRPLVLLDTGNFATADVNDLYRRLLNRSNRMAKLMDLGAPPTIIHNERRQLQEAFDALHANRFLPARNAVLGANDRPLVDLLTLLTRGLQEADRKRVEWCGMARAVATGAAADKHLLVPRSMFSTLHLEPDQPVLVTNPDDPEGTFVSLLPMYHDEAVLVLPRWAVSRLALDQADAPTCIVHRPLGAGACAEAMRLLEGDPGASREVPTADGWIDATYEDVMVRGLAEAALDGSKVPLHSPRGRLVAGVGMPVFAADTELVRVEPKVVEVATPDE